MVTKAADFTQWLAAVHARGNRLPLHRPHPLRPDDITATVYHALGLDPATEVHDQLKRPMPISAGQPIRPLFG